MNDYDRAIIIFMFKLIMQMLFTISRKNPDSGNVKILEDQYDKFSHELDKWKRTDEMIATSLGRIGNDQNN